MTPRSKRYQRAAVPAGFHPTDRDSELLTTIGDVGALSRLHIDALYFGGSVQTVCRRLRLLYDHGYIERVPCTGYGTPYVYTLGKRGSAWVSTLTGRPVRVKGRRAKTTDPFKRYPHLIHDLHISDFFVALALAGRQCGCEIIQWISETHLWQRHGAAPPSAEILPDAFFELLLPDDSSFLFFLENDESNHAHRIWRERAQAYLRYSERSTGCFRERFGNGERDHFRLLIVCPPNFRRRSRCQNLQQTIEQTVGRSDLFLLTTRDQITPDRILTDIWATPGTDQRCSLLSNPGVTNRAL